MYPSTKLDIDKHVEECLKKINNETERNLRCFSFAKQYFKIERFEDARRYILSYLSVKPDSAEAHYLLGRILERLGKKEAAYQAYSTSLRLDPKQNNLVLKVCELLASDDIEFDYSGAKYFCERAELLDSHNPSVSLLKQRIISSQNDDPRDVTNLLLKELEQRPNDIQLRIRLLKHLIQFNMIKEAYKHIIDIKQQDWLIFHNNLNWYEIVTEVLIKYQKNSSIQSTLGSDYWFLLIMVLDRLTSLCLDEYFTNIKTTTDYVSAVFNFDQTLLMASQHLNDCNDKQLIQEFLNHYRGQLYLHLITLMFKQANKEFAKYKEELYMVLPLLFAAYYATPPDLTSFWYTHLQDNRKCLLQRWRKEACFRCSQAGHILISAAKERKSIIIEKATQYSTGLWRDQLFKKLFITRDHQIKMPTSFLLSDDNLVNITIRLPEKNDLIQYDMEAQLLHPDSLHHHIWINLNNELGDIKCTVFEGLQYSIKNLKNCGVETLNFLDIQSFIYAATICAQSNLDGVRNVSYYNTDKPNVLPVAVTQQLATIEQNKFFKAAYKIYKNDYNTGVDQVRSVLIDGIKIIRCVDHTLDVKLSVKLANVFLKQTKQLTKQSEIDLNEARAALYWKVALPLLEKLKNNIKINIPPNNLFNMRFNDDMSMNDVYQHYENGKLFQAQQLMKKKEYERALRILELLKDPYASFYRAEIYKQMADQLIGQNKENVTSEMRSQNLILLSRARDCLYLTLDRLREPNIDQKHPLNAQLGTEIERIELLLSRIDPDCTNRNECDQVFDGNYSSNNSEEDLYVTGYTNNLLSRPIINNHSTPYRSDFMRREAKPSPERLDAQLRQLAASKDASFTHILEHNRIIMESHRSFVDELRGFKEAINHLTATVDEFKDLKTCVNELKHSITELDNFKTITDMVYEMKKEIAELKKDVNKTNQLSDEDIYGLTGDYTGDYNINSNLAAYNPNLYQNYHNRGVPTSQSLYGGPPPPPQAAAAPLYPLYPPMAYAYGGLSLSHIPGANLPTGNDQQLTPDFRTIPSGLLAQPNISYSQPLLQTTPSNNVPMPANLGLNLQTTIPSSILIKDPKIVPTNVATTKAPPVNVVITASDPLPTIQTTSQPILSVTIPAEHLKNKNQQQQQQQQPQQQQPHNYQIPLPTATITSTSPSILNKPSPTVTTKGLLMNIAPPVYSAVKEDTPVNVSLGLQIEKSLDQSLKNNSIDNTTLSKSNSSFDEHDPCPDFKPIIPLPDEVPITTGEENEIVLFCEHAQLYRHVTTNNTKEWKERGVGSIKILKNPQTNKIRVLMRRDQVHKICANHFITKDMILTSKNERSYIWAAHDFADGEVVVEKFCVRFKTSEEAKRFYDAFENAKNELDDNNKSISNSEKSKTLGGFVFSGTPVFKPKDSLTTTTTPTPIFSTPIQTTNQLSTQKSSPFANFTFDKQLLQSKSDIISDTTKTQSHDDHVDDFVPTAEFKPVIPLPELVEVKTGEENCQVLFESRSKLLRFDTSGTTKEWKERGIGVMKLLKDDNLVRLVMRRDQVHKVCCNHQLLKDMNFKIMPNNPTAVTWCAKDFSEGVFKNETFAIRFKTEELAKGFLKAITSAQETLDTNNNVKSEETTSHKHIKNDTSTKITTTPTTGFGDKFKPVKGSWECKNCYIVNDAKKNYCVACETPKNDNLPKKSDSSSGPAFSFGFNTNFTSPITTTTTPISTTVTTTTSWGNLFKPKEGTWECQSCCIRNDPDQTACVACNTTKAGGVKKTEPQFGVSTSFTTSPITTTVAPSISSTVTTTSSWGNLFKPKEGTWECQSCFVRNNPDQTVCISCNTSKSGVVVQKTEPQSVNLDTGGLKFNFGIPTTTTTTPGIDQTTKIDDKTTTTASQKFTFGLPVTASTGLGTKATFTFGQTSISSSNTDNKPLFGVTPIKQSSEVSKKLEAPSTPEKFVFGSPQKHDFEFTPRSPRRVSTGQKDDDSENSYLEEECDNIYFKPVIPLPDKVDVKTGEEDESVLYCHRAKLFRFVDGEWKERGLGDIKILKRNDNGKLRVLMRREQVFKICLNHTLTSDIKYVPKDAKTWLFCAPDFSEGVLSNDQFCIRFKTGEIAEDFKKAIDSALAGESTTTTKQDETSKDSDSDVEIVFETKVTPEEEQEAIKLGLPPKFMSYRQLQDCECDQCKKDDEYCSITNKTTNIIKVPQFNKESTVTTSNTTPTTTSTLKNLLSKPSLITPPTSSFTPPQTTSSSSFSGTTFTGVNIFTPKTTTDNKQSAINTFSFTAQASQSPSTFGNSSNIFGTTNTASPLSKSSTIFGGSSLFKTPEFKPSENVTTPSTTGSIFGTNTFTNSNIFSSANPKTGGSIFGTQPTQFGKIDENTSIFGGRGRILNPSKESNSPLLNPTGDTFASLAAKVSADAKPAFVVKESGDKPFAFLGAGAPVFASLDKSKSDKNKSRNDSNDETGTVDDEYDPHYEPIVPLPDAIVVSTGEEDETAIFNERAKLFRFDSTAKEWKERGVGQMKILYHPNNKTYRFLLRREQVHKVVLNQLIRPDLDLQPMSTSDRAWVWAGNNYLDEGPTIEKLAIKFKSCELSQQFHKIVQDVIVKLKENPPSKPNKDDATVKTSDDKLIPSSIQSYGVEDVSADDDDGDDEDYGEDEDDYVEGDDDDDDDDDEDDARAVMFIKRCTLSEEVGGSWNTVCSGDLRVYYDSDIYATRISLTNDSNQIVSSTIIGVNTVMEVDKNSCVWTGVENVEEKLRRRKLKATFDSDEAAQEFYSNYLEGLSYAKEVDIIDSMPEEGGYDE